MRHKHLLGNGYHPHLQLMPSRFEIRFEGTDSAAEASHTSTSIFNFSYSRVDAAAAAKTAAKHVSSSLWDLQDYH